LAKASLHLSKNPACILWNVVPSPCRICSGGHPQNLPDAAAAIALWNDPGQSNQERSQKY
jgi:hypothetical protein